jgi:hypothetical protein
MPDQDRKRTDGNPSYNYEFGPHELSHHVVVVPEAGEPFVISKSTPEELAEELKSWVGTRSYAFPFKGWRWAVSKGPTQRQLLDPNGAKYQLFDPEPNSEPDPDGSLFTREETVAEKARR